MESPEEREANKREREGSEKKEKKPKVKAMPAKVKAKPKEDPNKKAELEKQKKEPQRDTPRQSIKITKDNMHDQSFHDSRYYADVAAGKPHHIAWKNEKGRCRAILDRRSGLVDRVSEKLELDDKWHSKHSAPDTGKKRKDLDGLNANVETEVLDDRKDKSKPIERRDEAVPMSRKERESFQQFPDDEKAALERPTTRKAAEPRIRGKDYYKRKRDSKAGKEYSAFMEKLHKKHGGMTPVRMHNAIYLMDFLDCARIEGRLRLFWRASQSGVSPELQPLEDAPAASAGAPDEESGEEVGEEQAQVIVKRSPALLGTLFTGAGDEEGRIPHVSLDYCYMNAGQEKRSDSESDGILPCLIVKCHKTGRYWANVVPSNGADLFSVVWLKACLNETGFNELVLKSDNEPAMLALKGKVKEESKLKIHMVEAPVEDHQANGYIEVGVWELKRQVRAILSDLQERLGFEVEPSHPCMMWLPRHAAYLRTRFRIGPDGKTPYERTFGKKWGTPLVSFGEHILFRPRPLRDGRRRDLAPRVSMGMYVGTGLRNNDVFVMTARGIVKGNTITRRPPEDQFKYENWSELRGVPWRLQAREPGEVRVDLPVVAGPMTRPPVEEVIPRNLYVTKSDNDKFGYTPLCPGCEAQLMGTGRRAHNPECRFRIESELMKTEEGKQRIEAAKARIYAGRRPKAPRVGGGAGEPEVVEAASVPALVGVPEPDAEMALGEAVGEPLERVARRELEDRGEHPGSPKKKQKSGGHRTKRSAQADIEELHHQMQDEAAVLSHQELQSQLQTLHLEAAAPWI
ncbi:unnamed protein product [Durusdinium trenchii]|uniref:Integrase catalytic domain-containing protein n=1 Tax=Durusdinium trenchii TaxID=1381693 RepID=A0ABP0I6H5_9DINO